MPSISSKTKDKISEQILAHLFSNSPEPQYTAHISRELARDEEFVKDLLHDLEKKSFVVKVTKNSSGIEFSRRQRWRLSNKTFEAYNRINSRFI